ncbi:Gfo/Idh/MocA family protein [Paraglaciecola arctica]|uniref:Gfo/Idh/MocA family protein n=1 Tax=Paraglaciecola arctica TaxID=1128911 RepID=UPI001C0725EE|nr:Gfo/Idh/MocA family oxidoreductase [Paraglaciecola arctica]MBU3005562.1 Gfo/Idh/MocA family oxidoreductase [Paraglaciecola arctica]
MSIKPKSLNVALVGTRFMGKAHSNAWSRVDSIFDSAIKPVLKVVCGRDQTSLDSFADRWGWRETSLDWRATIERDDIDIVDISLPTHMHAEVAIAAAKAGKHVFCEKPMSITVKQAQEMVAAVTSAGVVNYINHNYRRMPAVMLAKQLISEGKIGEIYHWRGTYQQDWIIDPNFPLTWHLQKEYAGSGPHGDLNSHSVDLAHFLVGEIDTLSCQTARFIDERPLPATYEAATFTAGTIGEQKGKVTVEDTSLMIVRFANGAMGSFEATRFAAGRKNHNSFEIYGSEGSVIFDLERPNELAFYSRNDEPHMQGFRTILATDPSHPYISKWWPPGHNIGYEHTFVHAVADFLDAISKGNQIHPNFSDGLKTIKVLETALKSSENNQHLKVIQ